jgi:hypothetical protein
MFAQKKKHENKGIVYAKRYSFFVAESIRTKRCHIKAFPAKILEKKKKNQNTEHIKKHQQAKDIY